MELTAIYNPVEPAPEYIDFDGMHFPISGGLAFLYRMFLRMESREAAEKNLYPYLFHAKKERIKMIEMQKSGINHHEEAAQTR